MESNSGESARAQLEELASGREQALARITLPWPYVVGYAVLMNGCTFTVVLPIFMSEDWTMLVQAACLAGLIAMVKLQRRRHGVRRALLRVRGAWILNVVLGVSFVSALAVATYARVHDDAWLGIGALLINFVAWLAAYGGVGLLLRRQVNRVA
jgi:hypothetical protein